jgi:hypothetical protein
MNLPRICRSGLHTHFVTRLHLRLTLSHTFPQHSTSTLLPEPERYSFTPKKGITQVPFESWSDSPTASWGRPEFERQFQIAFLPIWWAGLPGWFPSPSGFLWTTGTHLLGFLGERLPPLDQHSLVAPAEAALPGPETLSQIQGGGNTTLQILAKPPEML